MTRITDMELTFQDMLILLADGNPGAITAMMHCANASPIVDPLAWAGPYQPLLHLDSFGIYGPQIWVLYKDLASQSTVNTLALLRAVQLGILSQEELHTALQRYHLGQTRADNNERVNQILLAVQQQLPSFNTVQVAT